MSFKKETKILDVVTDKTSDIIGTRHSNPSKILIKLPYLNSYKKHHSKLSMSLVCDGDIDTFYVNGGGEGWSLEHKKIPPELMLGLVKQVFILLFIEIIGIFSIIFKNRFALIFTFIASAIALIWVIFSIILRYKQIKRILIPAFEELFKSTLLPPGAK